MFNYFVLAPFQSYLSQPQHPNHVVLRPTKLNSRAEALEALAMGFEVHVYMPSTGMISFMEPAPF